MGNYFETSVYRKNTHTGVFLNRHAIAPTAWKRGLIFCLLHRAKLICSSIHLFWDEVSKLRQMFFTNGYSFKFFDQVCEKFMNQEPQKDKSVSTQDSAESESVPFCLLKSAILW